MKREIILYLIVTVLGCFFCSVTLGYEISYDSSAKEWMFSAQSMGINRYGLISNGYDINDINDIKRAAFLDKESGIRECAIWFLAIKMDSDSIPILKQALNDSDPMNRRRAARLLGFLGDNSGLEVMKKDMEELSQGGYDKVTKEVRANNPEVPSLLLYKSFRLSNALESANVLAEFGDTSGYKLSVENAIESKFPGHRRTAIDALSELARLDKNVLEEKGVFPEKVLLDVLEKEDNASIIDHMILDAKIFMIPETGNKILEKISLSERFSSEQRQKAKKRIQEIQKRIEREKKLKENEITM